MKNIKCSCENCITLDICQERAEIDGSLLVFRKNTKCKELSAYLTKCKGNAKYYRMDRTKLLLGVNK